MMQNCLNCLHYDAVHGKCRVLCDSQEGAVKVGSQDGCTMFFVPVTHDHASDRLDQR